MKKHISFLIAGLCVVVAFVPLLASVAGAAAEDAEPAEPVLTVVQLDAATSTDAGQTQAASMTDISVNYEYDTSAGPVLKVDDAEVAEGKLNVEEGSSITFQVTNSQPCVFLYDSGSTGLVALDAVSAGENTYTFSTTAWLDMNVYVAVKGDVDGSGVVDAGDVSSVTDTILSGTQPTGKELLITDTNGDGVINTTDLTALKAEINGERYLEW